jgi:DNA-binding beta-propeller fold protein YncE
VPNQLTSGSCGNQINGVNYIKVDPAGTYAYLANGWALYLSVCTINPNTGALTDVAGSPFGVGARPLGIGVVHH